MTIICCPEDCMCDAQSHDQRTVCSKCKVPVWMTCKKTICETYAVHPPATSLANDMMIFYASPTLYNDRLTVVEMICCSVCIASSICMSMEIKYGHMLDTEVHFQTSRVAARGSATSFNYIAVGGTTC